MNKAVTFAGKDLYMSKGLKTMLLGIGLILFGLVLSVRVHGAVESSLGSFIIWGSIILGMAAIIVGYFSD